MFLKYKNNWLLFNQKKPCVLCRQTTENPDAICSGCAADLPWLTLCCNRCALPLNSTPEHPTLCPDCLKKPPPFTQIIAPFEYRFPIDQMILQAKFNNRSYLLPPLAYLLADKLKQSMTEHSRIPDLIIAVPLHPSRLLERQYNQSAILAKIVAQQLNIPLSNNLLIKQNKTPHQASLDHKTRQKNLKDSFRCLSTPPTSVAIIDDVVTTAATVTEISRLLLRKGCQNVDIWAIARTGKELFF